MPGTTPAPGGAAPQTIGKFVILARLGAGAFGTVYKARDPQLKREVAVKVPNPGVLSSPTRAERLLREAQAAARLRHPNIVPVYEAGKDGDRYYIVSALIVGKPLAEAIGEQGMDFARAAGIVRQLADAAAEAHAAGIVHRDIKPANVLLDAGDRPHLADFGLAAQGGESKLTNEGALIGTPSYMAPEQAAGQRGDAKPASDTEESRLPVTTTTGRTTRRSPRSAPRAAWRTCPGA